jgi:uncharacterized FAD-dependent dehydrogenase
MPLLVANIPWMGEDVDPVPGLARFLSVADTDVVSAQLLKRSVDGRRRPPVWMANFRVELQTEALETACLAKKLHGVRPFVERDESRWSARQKAPLDACRPSLRPVVVGAGPAGLFAALALAEAGARPVLIERGGPVEDRHHDVRRFWRHAELNPESNVVFGEGGAGAFSDGKIYTRRRDGDLGWIFQRFVDFGASPEILAEGWAHLGTDRIRALLPVLRQRLLDLGADVEFHTAVSELVVHNGRCVGVRAADGRTWSSDAVLIATGHSARDVWAMLESAGVKLEQRPIHIGARIEHPQKLIDLARYGAPRGELPPASYRLTSNPKSRRGHPAARRAHTFCMCPGGTIVGATNHPGRVVVNGMSYSKRQAFWANSAVVTEVFPADYGQTDPLAGTRFQDAIEVRAFEVGGGRFQAPGQRVVDLLAGRPSTDLPRTSYPLGVTPADLRDVLPPAIVEGMMAAIRHFHRKLPGFAGPDAILVAPETRTTAPVRVLRDDNLEAEGLPGLLPVGEGAGYAGGIISAALDGLRAAQSVAARYGSEA